MGYRRCTADGGHMVGQPAAERIAESAAALARAGTVQRVDHDRNGRSQTRPTAQPCGMRQVRVQHVGLFALEPAMKANPAARIGEPLAHLKARERHAACAQLRGRRAAIAVKHDHAHAPAAPAQPFGQQHGLPFRPANAVQAGDCNRCVAHVRLHACASINSSYASIARSKANSSDCHFFSISDSRIRCRSRRGEPSATIAVQAPAISMETAINGSDRAHKIPVRAKPNQGRNTAFLQRHNCEVPGRIRLRRHSKRLRDGSAPNRRNWSGVGRRECGLIVRRKRDDSFVNCFGGILSRRIPAML